MQEFELKIIISLITIGFVGGFSHCAFMCGPFVMMQVNNNLKKISIDNLNHFTRLKGLALIPYHLGRITTYSFLGFFSSLFGKNIKNHTNSHLISAILLFLAALIVFNLILKL